MGINVRTLLQETNNGSDRWWRSAAWVPNETLPKPGRLAERRAADELDSMLVFSP